MIDVPPSGCYWCGCLERFHASRWSAKLQAFHGYVPPTDEQILQRMRARQVLRQRGTDAA